jgi:hypothetical protein
MLPSRQPAGSFSGECEGSASPARVGRSAAGPERPAGGITRQDSSAKVDNLIGRKWSRRLKRLNHRKGF